MATIDIRTAEIEHLAIIALLQEAKNPEDFQELVKISKVTPEMVNSFRKEMAEAGEMDVYLIA